MLRKVAVLSTKSRLGRLQVLSSPQNLLSRPAASASFATTASTTATSSGNERKCPFTQSRGHSTALEGDSLVSGEVLNRTTTTLKDVPAVPVFGAFVDIFPLIGNFLNDNFYQNPSILKENAYDYHYSMYEKFGSFYSTYIPGVGEGLYPKVYMLMDPQEMKKVIRQEGAFPRGGAETLKPMVKWMKKNKFKIAGETKDDNGFLGRGENWKRVRTFMQTDLLSPKSANGYVPGVSSAAKIASQAMPHYAQDLNKFLNYSAFDMFQTIMFGQLSTLADPNTPSDPQDVEFCQLAVDSLAYLIKISHDKQETVMFSMGFETEVYTNFEKAMDGLKTIVMQKMSVFKERWERNELNEYERNSYFAHAIERQRAGDDTVDENELMEIGLMMLNASVDTTATFIAWAMVHLSVNPEAQEKLYQELKQILDENNGKLNSDALTKSKSPYLHAFLRESHRMTPVHPTTMFKSNSNADIEIHGETIPKDSIIGFDNYALGMDPNIVENPDMFLPERWIDDKQIEARKGTPAEALDSIFFRDPFSQGARRCPGSRVAVNETQLMLSQIVLDWKVTAPDTVKSYKDVPYTMQTLLVPQLPEMKIEARA